MIFATYSNKSQTSLEKKFVLSVRVLAGLRGARCRQTVNVTDRYLMLIDCSPIIAGSVVAMDEAPSAPISFELPWEKWKTYG
jgi:hypothetical protein